MANNIKIREAYLIMLHSSMYVTCYNHLGKYDCSRDKELSILFTNIKSAVEYVIDENIMGENTTDKDISICLYSCVSNVPITMIEEHIFNNIHRRLKLEKILKI